MTGWWQRRRIFAVRRWPTGWAAEIYRSCPDHKGLISDRRQFGRAAASSPEMIICAAVEVQGLALGAQRSFIDLSLSAEAIVQQCPVDARRMFSLSMVATTGRLQHQWYIEDMFSIWSILSYVTMPNGWSFYSKGRCAAHHEPRWLRRAHLFGGYVWNQCDTKCRS